MGRRRRQQQHVQRHGGEKEEDAFRRASIGKPRTEEGVKEKAGGRGRCYLKSLVEMLRSLAFIGGKEQLKDLR